MMTIVAPVKVTQHQKTSDEEQRKRETVGKMITDHNDR